MKKSNVLRMVVFFLAMVLLLSGCAGKQAKINLVTADKASSVSGRNYLIEPVDSMGLTVTDAIRKGEVTIFHGIFPNILGGEYIPLRICWHGDTVQMSDGKEFFTQYMLTMPEFGGSLTWTIVMDGHPDETAVTVAFSSLVEYLYDALGKEIVLPSQSDFANKTEDRKKFVLEHGTPIKDLKRVSFREFLKAVGEWNVLKTSKGDVLTPLTKEALSLIAETNPQYAEWEKLLSENHTSLFYGDPISLGVYNALEAYRTVHKVQSGGVPSIGADFRSQLVNRRQMGENIAAFESMRESLIKKMNEVNRECIQGGQQ